MMTAALVMIHDCDYSFSEGALTRPTYAHP